MTPPATTTPAKTQPARDPLTRFAWIVIGINLGIILWGALVRATGSGAGCGSHWPLCNGEALPTNPSLETFIELFHRVTSGLALIAVVVLVVRVYRGRPAGHPARAAAMAALVFMLGEAAIGAGLVLFELVAENASMARALFMATHLGNTFLLLAALTLTAHWLGGGAPLVWRGQGRIAWLLGAALIGTGLIGISGAIAALGDTLFPATSLREALAQDLSPTSHLLIQLRVLHPLIAVTVGLLVLYVVSLIRRERSYHQARRPADLLNLLVVVQLLAGGINIVLLAPIWMQLVHLLLADLLWICLVLTAANRLTRAADVPSDLAVSERPVPAPVSL